MLKKLTTEGLIRGSASEKNRSSETAQRSYEITPEGAKCLKDGKEMFAHAGEKWTAVRRIFMDLMDPSQISEFLTEGSKLHFQFTRELIESKVPSLSRSEAEFTLKDYVLNLERQLEWARSRLAQTEKKALTATTPRVKTR